MDLVGVGCVSVELKCREPILAALRVLDAPASQQKAWIMVEVSPLSWGLFSVKTCTLHVCYISENETQFHLKIESLLLLVILFFPFFFISPKHGEIHFDPIGYYGICGLLCLGF